MEDMDRVGERRIKGYWWLPGNQTGQVPGVFTFQPNVTSQLELFGSLSQLGGLESEWVALPKEIVRIHGRDSGRAVTLLDCFWTRSSGGLGSQDLRIENLHVGGCLLGAWFDESEPLAFDGAQVEIRHLRQWVGRSARRLSRSPTDGAIGPPRLDSIHLEPLRIELPQEGVLTLRNLVGSSTSVEMGPTITERAVAKFEFETATSIEDIVLITGKLQNLVSLSVDSLSPYIAYELYSSDCRVGADKQGYLPISLLANWNYDDGLEHANGGWSRKAVASFEELGGLEGVQRWWGMSAQLHEAADRAVAARFSEGMFVSDRVVHRCAALQCIGRSIQPNSGSLAAEISAVVGIVRTEFESLVSSELVERWKRATIDLRNDAVHPRRNPFGSDLAFYCGEAAHWLIVLALFRQIEAIGAIEKVVACSEFKHVGRRLTELLSLS